MPAYCSGKGMGARDYRVAGAWHSAAIARQRRRSARPVNARRWFSQSPRRCSIHAGHGMKLSTRLTVAMVALVLFAIAVTGVLTYRNLLEVAVPRSLERLGGHVELLAAELQAVVSAARADVLAFAVEQMVSGGSGEIADASSVFATA